MSTFSFVSESFVVSPRVWQPTFTHVDLLGVGVEWGGGGWGGGGVRVCWDLGRCYLAQWAELPSCQHVCSPSPVPAHRDPWIATVISDRGVIMAALRSLWRGPDLCSSTFAPYSVVLQVWVNGAVVGYCVRLLAGKCQGLRGFNPSNRRK